MTEEETKPDIPTITCPNCEREWPLTSEQAVVCELVEECYACFIQAVVDIRDKRMMEADYVIENCPKCTGVGGDRAKCITCGGRGWKQQDDAGIIARI